MRQAPGLGGILFILLIVASIASCLGDDLKPSRSVIDVPRIKAPIQLEDFLKSKRLEKLKKIGSFVQTGRNEGIPAIHQTEAYLAHDDSLLIVFFVCSGPTHSSVDSESTKAKSQSSKEWVEVVIDLFGDLRRSYVFRTNPTGLRQQGEFLQGVYASDVNQPWYSECQLTDKGYVVELSIPYASFDPNFANPALHRIWGLRLRRWLSDTQEYIHWPGPNEQEAKFQRRSHSD
jgi:hypothetical protein